MGFAPGHLDQQILKQMSQEKEQKAEKLSKWEEVSVLEAPRCMLDISRPLMTTQESVGAAYPPCTLLTPLYCGVPSGWLEGPGHWASSQWRELFPTP
jgi:hypothetical protein